MKTLRVGIVGAGGIVRQRHLPGLRAQPGVEVAAVANSTLASSQAFCAGFAPEAEAIETWETLVARPDLDIVWIGATPHLHKPVAIAALDAGKHVFCQARMARDLTEAVAMFQAAAAHPGLVTMLCPPPHGLKGDAFMRSLLDAKIVGQCRTIRLRSLSDAFLDPGAPIHFRQRRELSGENILTLGIHAEVLQRWLGDFEVSGAQGAIHLPTRGGVTVDVPDSLQVLAKFPGPVLGHFEFSGVHAGPPEDFIEIVGSTGTLRYDYLSDQITLLSPDAAQPETLPIPADLLGSWQVEADFIRAVRDPAAPRPHPDSTDGLRYMRVVQKVASLLAPR